MTRTALYRHFDASGALLYVGISNDPVSRLGGHRRGSHWVGDIASITCEWFASRVEAEDAERSAIGAERPLHNRQFAVSIEITNITSLIDAWQTRADFAAAVGGNTQAVHKWAKTGRIPSDWQLAVVNAAQAAGHSHVTADWIIQQHARAV